MKYSIKTTAKNPFNWTRFVSDWNSDGGNWRLVITPPNEKGIRKGFLFTTYCCELNKIGMGILEKKWLNSWFSPEPNYYGHRQSESRVLLREFSGTRRNILREAQELEKNIEEKLNEKSYVLVYGD